ncbi:hypothetical protein V5E97_18825 [Singulisphaera sp. Ch08]|uniref:Uncharacterized protein n=1 Tax=Singulisphaera sp. Ch08 TaxID=3120278 RepID=A0AAU7CSQ9_9BACT
MDQTKRELRQQKREIKRAGGKRRRRLLKQGLAERPDEATHTEFDFGRSSSAKLNGIDRDSTRQRRSHPEATESKALPDPF